MLLLILPLIFLTGCGLSDYFYIYPPLPGSNLNFSHDSRNNKDPNFLVLGYDLYYRIYANSDFEGMDDSAIRSKLISDANAYFTSSNISNIIARNFNSNPPYMPVYYYSDDKNNGYDSNKSPPFLPVDNSVVSDKQFLISINFTNVDDPYLYTEPTYSSDTLPEEIHFKRYLYLEDEKFKDFSTYDIVDSDVPNTVTNDSVLLAFFVISYGFTVDLYSITSEKPLFIGYIEL